MRKLFTMLLVVAMLILPITASAKEETANFEGFIFPAREFYIGEYASYSDFKIDGTFVDMAENKIIPQNEWKIYAIESVKEDYINIVMKYMPDMDKDIPRYNDISYTVPIETKTFNPVLKRQVYGIFHTNETDVTKIFNKNDFVFKNSLNRSVPGELTYENIALKKGVNTVKYQFTPYKELITDYGYETYKPDIGTIKIILY